MRTRRLKAHPDAPSGFYHCMSRVVDRQFIFGEAEKEHFANLMRRYAHFCGVRIITFCLMGNHFHLLIEVPKRPDSPPADDILLDRIRAIYPRALVQQIRTQLSDPSMQPPQKDFLRHQFWKRMGDLSQYLKELKQRFSQWHNLRHGRRGTLWEERFKSVLIGPDGSALTTVAAYIDLNPVRAGLVANPSAYRWSGYGQASAGRPEALAGYQVLAAVGAGSPPRPSQALRLYRTRLFDRAERRRVFPPARADFGSDGGSPESQAHKPWLPRDNPGLFTQLLHRIRYFSDGAAIGSRSFVESIALHHRSWLRKKRQTAPHPLSHFKNASLFSLRPLRIQATGQVNLSELPS